MVVARRYGEAVEHDSQNAVLGDEVEPVRRVGKPEEIILGKGELAARPESLGLVERKGQEALHARAAQVDFLVEADALGLAALDLAVDGEVLGRFLAGKLQELAARHPGRGCFEVVLVDLDLVALIGDVDDDGVLTVVGHAGDSFGWWPRSYPLMLPSAGHSDTGRQIRRGGGVRKRGAGEH